MRCLILISLLCCLSCSPYRKLPVSQQDFPEVEALISRPVFDRSLYHCYVEGNALFKKYRFSGLLYFKRMEDHSVHVVFQNQMGLSFFDFHWAADGRFEVIHILDALNKPALIKTLRKDFEILLGIYSAGQKICWLSDQKHRPVLQVNREADKLFYSFQDDSRFEIEKIELWGRCRKVLDFRTIGFRPGGLPDSVMLYHKRARFRIELKKITKANEQG